MVRNLLLSLMVIGLVFTGCKTGPETKPDDTIPPPEVAKYSVEKGRYTSPSNSDAKITFFTFVENEFDMVVKLKRIDIKDQEPMYTIVYGVRGYSSDVRESWDDRRSNYKSYLYNDDGIMGLEVAYVDRFNMQMQNLPQNNMYLEYNDGEVFAFTMPLEYWSQALQYILYE